MSYILPSDITSTKKFTLDAATVSLPETALEVSAHLGFSSLKSASMAWYELSGAVLSHYLVDQQQRLEALLKWFYQDLGFCPREDYFSADAADLANSLVSRQGNSTTLGVILMLLAKQLDLNFEPILLPGYTLLRSQINNEFHYIDPLTGKAVSRHYMHALVRGELGNSAPFKSSYLKPVDTERLLTRMLHELKAGCIVSGKFEAAMECCNLLLQWHPEDTHLHRERAFIAQQLGCITLAVSDLQYFIDQSPHDPLIELVKLQLKELNDHQDIYH